ncbi:hypothetical protein GCM10029963_22820 [Micromonospora andamanensis]
MGEQFPAGQSERPAHPDQGVRPGAVADQGAQQVMAQQIEGVGPEGQVAAERDQSRRRRHPLRHKRAAQYVPQAAAQGGHTGSHDAGQECLPGDPSEGLSRRQSDDVSRILGVVQHPIPSSVSRSATSRSTPFA